MTKDENYVGETWLNADNDLRRDRHKKSLTDENFLRGLNAALEEEESTLPIPDEEPAPLILFYGLPRCGKTFFSQALRASLDLGMIDNFAARFWLAPCHGIRLSRILGIADLESHFQSDYGKTSALGDPHDFAYFWQKWFHWDHWPYDAEASRAHIDWRALGSELRRISQEWARAGLMKGVIPSYHMSKFHQAYRKTLFVFLERDLIDVAYSILRGRREIYQDEMVLYGQLSSPGQAAQYKGLSAYDQIALQIRDLLAMYEAERAHLASGTHMSVNYGELCDNPAAIVDGIAAAVKDAFGYEIPRIGQVPAAKVRKSVHRSEHDDLELLARALDAAGLATRYA